MKTWFSRLGEVDESAFTIGLLHANVGGNTDHALYAPCSLEDLAQSGIDYWALGHVHTRQVLRERTPTVVYPGNPQGRHPNETGARGVYLVEVDDYRQRRPGFSPYGHCAMGASEHRHQRVGNRRGPA